MAKRTPAQLKAPKKPAQQNRGVSFDGLLASITQDVAKKLADPNWSPFAPNSIPTPAPGVLPKNHGKTKLAMDQQVINTNAWAVGQLQNAALANGIVFLGFPYLSELAQIAEYRAIAEVTATEMTREWIEFKSTATDKASKAERIKELTEEFKRLDVQGNFRRIAELDLYFGRSHLYLDTGDTEKPDELKITIGDGRNGATKAKFNGKESIGFLKALRPVEPIWAYPAEYTSNNPLRGDWYNPQSWWVLGNEVHVSRFLTFVGREVPDMLKPAYMFGGLPMSQMVKPTVDNWLRARKSVADILSKFSAFVLKTGMDATTTEGGVKMLTRARVMSQFLNNNGLLMLDKEAEDFVNVAAPLASLDHLQAQAQEHQSAVSHIPLVKLTGISPSGLNATSEFEMQTWYEWVRASQVKLFTKHLNSVTCFAMISLWGEIDPEIVWEFKPLKALSAKELVELQKTKADTAAVYIQSAVISPEDDRKRLASDPDSPYDGLDVSDDEPDLEAEGEVDGELGRMFPDVRREEGREDDDTGRRSDTPPRNREGRPDRTRGSRAREPREFN